MFFTYILKRLILFSIFFGIFGCNTDSGKNTFFKVCNFKPEQLTESDITYFIAGFEYKKRLDEAVFSGEDERLKIVARRGVINEKYRKQAFFLLETKKKFESGSIKGMFVEDQGFKLPKNCKNQTEYLNVLESAQKSLDNQYKEAINLSNSRMVARYDRIFERYNPAFDKSIEGFSSGRNIVIYMPSILQTEGIENAKNTLFSASKYTGWEYYTLLACLEGGVAMQFNPAESLEDNLCDFNKFKTFVERVDDDKVIVKSERNLEWIKFIIQPSKGQKFEKGQSLDEYAFKIIKTEQYKENNWIVVEAFK